MDRLVGDRQPQVLGDLRPQRLQIADQAVLLGEAEIGVDYQLARLDDMPLGEPLLPRTPAVEGAADRLLEPRRIERGNRSQMPASQRRQRVDRSLRYQEPPIAWLG
jgi:hypothetical protein